MKERHPFTQLLILLFIGTLFTSCASSSITSVPKIKTDRPYSSLMLVCVQGGEFRGFTESNYDMFVKNGFNNVDDFKYRKQLERTLSRNIAPMQFPRVVKSTEAFDIDEPYNYDDFMAKVKRSGSEAILVVNLDNFWTTSDYVTTHYEHSSLTREQQEPNSSYDVYLYDVKNLEEYVWVAKVTVNGIYAGYDTLNNYLARRISQKLRKEKYIP